MNAFLRANRLYCTGRIKIVSVPVRLSSGVSIIVYKAKNGYIAAPAFKYKPTIKPAPGTGRTDFVWNRLLTKWVLPFVIGTTVLTFGFDEMKKSPEFRDWLDGVDQTDWYYPFVLLNFAIYALCGGGRIYRWLDRAWPNRKAFMRSNFTLSVSRTYFSSWWTWITSGFTHFNKGHIIGNMFFIGFFALNARHSPIDVINWFLLGAFWCGAIIVPFEYYFATKLLVARKVAQYSLGASGGYFGILGGMAYYNRSNKRKEVGSVYDPFPSFVPSQFTIRGFVLFYAVLSVLGVYLQLKVLRRLGRQSLDRVSHIGHLGGLVGGAFAAFANDKIFKNTIEKRQNKEDVPKIFRWS